MKNKNEEYKFLVLYNIKVEFSPMTSHKTTRSQQLLDPRAAKSA